MELVDGHKNADKTKSFTRRAFVIGALQGALLVSLGGRLAWLQIAQGQRYKMLSDKNRINVKLLIPSRGQIVDRFGVPLAVNNQNFIVTVIPEQTDDLEKSLRSLKSIIDLDEGNIQTVLKQAKRSAGFLPLEVKDNLNWDEVSKIEVNLPDLPGLSIDVGEIRNYPFGKATAHIVGYVGAVNKSELTGDPVLELPGFKVGKTGIEKSRDLDMQGKAGNSEVEVNVVGREIRELDRHDSIAGDRVMLSIDGEFQRFTQEKLERERSASAVVMDVHTGAIYAMASNPSFDPNMFTRGISAVMWEELLADPGYPLTNKAVAGQYPPASTFKMITAMAGFRAGKITPERTVYCPGHYDFGQDRFHCWKKGGHGSVNVTQALAQSCDVYFYEMGLEAGIDKIAETAREFGLGQQFSFDLTEERPGLVPDKDWKYKQYKTGWQPGETIVTSIGQGYLQSTPLQLAVMVSRLVNGGYEVRPWITGYVGDSLKGRMQWPKMNIDPAYLASILRGMETVVNDPTGTAYGSRITEAGMEFAGKTGTAQVKRITMQQRNEGVKNEDLPWLSRHHALFVGYAPYTAPRYACCVVVEHGVGGAKSAAPLVRDLLLEVQKRDPALTPMQPAAQKNDSDRYSLMGPLRPN